MEVIGAAGVIQPLLMENNRDGDYGLVAFKMVPGKLTPAEVKGWLLNDLVALINPFPQSRSPKFGSAHLYFHTFITFLPDQLLFLITGLFIGQLKVLSRML